MKHNSFVLMIAAAMGIVALPAAAETFCGGESAQTGVDLTSGTRTAQATETIVYSPFWAATEEGACVDVSVQPGGALVSSAMKAGTYAWTTPTAPGTYTLTHKTTESGSVIDTLTAKFEVLAEVTVADVTGATYAAYTNDAPATVPFVVSATTPIKVIYTAKAGYMFSGGYKTFETNLTANAAEMTVTLTADQQPVVAQACEDCLTFSADAAFGIKMWKDGTPAEPKLEYSTDKTYWSKFDLVNGAAAGADNKLYLRGTGNKKISKSKDSYYAFTNTAESAATAIACSGNIMTLLDYETVAKDDEPAMEKCAFYDLFNGFAALTAAPALPATNLTDNCYNSMFYGCTKLAVAPVLPATNLAEGCYRDMFWDCTSLTAAPALPAKKLAKDCYSYMFEGCTALTDLPELPATTLAEGCYQSMFECCSALEVNAAAPGKEWKLPDAEEAKDWNEEMFLDTKGNVKAPELNTTYYIASAVPPEPIAFDVTAPEHATAEVYTNEVSAANRVPAGGTVWSNRVAKAVYTVKSDKDWYFKGDDGWVKAITNELDTTVNPAVDKTELPSIIEATCTRKVVTTSPDPQKSEEVASPYVLEKGKTYTAAPTTEEGGVFKVNSGATLTGTNVTFAANRARKGGAIYNGGTVVLKDVAFAGNSSGMDGGAICNNGTVTLNGVTFEGNKASDSGGAICNLSGGMVNFDGSVTLVTTTDKISNQSALNWNLADGKAGALNGYEKLSNRKKAKLQLTVEDYATARNFVIATGDFTDVSGKDTFSITNVAGGAALSGVTINGSTVVSKDGLTGYRLVTEKAGKTTRLVLQVLPAVTVNLTQNNATAYTNGVPVTKPFQMLTNDTITVTYKANAGYYFADGSDELRDVVVKASADPTTGPENQDVNAYEPHVCDGVSFTKRITDTASLRALLMNGGNGYLATNVTLTAFVGQYFVTNNLCLNGQVLNANGYQLKIYDTMTIYDCGTTTNYFTIAESGLWELTDDIAKADTNLVGGVVTGGKVYSSFYVGLWNEGYPAPMLTVKGGNYVGNGAGCNYGGVIYGYYGNVVIEGGVFAGNCCDYCGGAIYAYDSTITVTNGTFIGNCAEYGGVIELEKGDNDGYAASLVVDDGLFLANSAECGGVLATYSYDDELTVEADIHGGTFEGNTADYGGVFYADKATTATIDGGMFTGNEASCGGVYFSYYDNAALMVSNSVLFVGNKVTGDDGSGAVFFNNGTLTLQDNVIVSDNVAGWGTIYNYGTLTVTGNVQVVDNVVTGNGGAIYNRYYSSVYPGTCYVYGGTFARNGDYTAFVNQGGTFELGGNPVITDNGYEDEEYGFEEYDLCVSEDSSFMLSTTVPYNPPAGQKLTISTFSDDTYGAYQVTVVTNATAADLYRFASASSDYVLKHRDGTLYLERTWVATRFVETACSVPEGAETTVSVFGGSDKEPCQATLSYVKGSGAYTTAYLDGERVSFPLTLVWEKGDISVRKLVFRTAYSKRAEGDKYFSLQLAGAAGTVVHEGKDVCTVRIIDREAGDAADYVQALAYPANGGKVSGSGALKRDADGAVTSSRTLAVTPNTFATFAGWYAAKVDNPGEIDFDNPLSRERKLKVGKGTELAGGTYYAYFVDVLPVAAVVKPKPFDAEGRPLPGVEGVTGWDRADDVYGTMVGVKFALPVEIEDESDAGKLTIKGLPSGLKYNAKAGRIEGVPTKAGVFTATFVAKNAAGSQTVAYMFKVEDLWECAIGTFNGVVNDATNRAGVGSVTFTAGKTGALSAKVTRRLSGTRSFSVKGYDYIDERTLGVEMENNAGEVFEATLSRTNGIYEAVLVGTADGGKLWENHEDDGTFRAFRNTYAEKRPLGKEIIGYYVGTYEEPLATKEGDGSVQYRLKDNGSVTIKAKMPGKTVSGTAAGAFRFGFQTGIGGLEAALRSGKSIWSTAVELDDDKKSAAGQARYIRGEDLDDDQLVGEEAKPE